MADIHSCSYYCARPECIKAQRDELRDRLEAQSRITTAQVEQIKRLASLLETRVRAVYVLADDDEDRESLNDDVAETSADLRAALDALKWE